MNGQRHDDMTNRIAATLRWSDYRAAHRERMTTLAIAALDFELEQTRENSRALKIAAKHLSQMERHYSDCEPDMLLNRRERRLWQAAILYVQCGASMRLAEEAVRFARSPACED